MRTRMQALEGRDVEICLGGEIKEQVTSQRVRMVSVRQQA
jgi:hypothetical protein